MPEVNTKMFTDDSILSEFDDFPLDLPQIEPDIQIMSPSQVTAPHVIDNLVNSQSTMPKQCPKSAPLIKPSRKLVEKPIQPNYIIEQNVDKKIRYIQKPGTHTLLPIQNVGQIQLPAEQMKQVLLHIPIYVHFFHISQDCNKYLLSGFSEYPTEYFTCNYVYIIKWSTNYIKQYCICYYRYNCLFTY